jgi:hypothetical protein
MHVGSSAFIGLSELDAMIARADAAYQRLKLAAADGAIKARRARRLGSEMRTMGDIRDRLKAERRMYAAA